MGHQHPHSQRNIAVAFFLNLVFTVIEIAGGFFTNSVAILSDALHDLGDSLSLGLAWYLEKYSKKKRDQKYTYGYSRFSLLGAIINGLVLVGGSVFIISQAVPRLFSPQSPDAAGMFWLAILGIVFNGFAAMRLHKGTSLNEQMVSWHLWEDVLGWVVVLVLSIVMYFWEVPILDPLFSILFTGYICYNVFKSLIRTVKIFLQAKPEGVDLEDMEQRFAQIEGVQSVHDLHLWSLDGRYFIMTLHLVVHDSISKEDHIAIKQQAQSLSKTMKVKHTTIEVEYASEHCELVDE
ncbi:MAG: cation diffusion facilitator family transporter [Cyclobacteriaceae bacterium]